MTPEAIAGRAPLTGPECWLLTHQFRASVRTELETLTLASYPARIPSAAYWELELSPLAGPCALRRM